MDSIAHINQMNNVTKSNKLKDRLTPSGKCILLTAALDPCGKQMEIISYVNMSFKVT